MTKSSTTLMQRLAREDFCYREFPLSMAFHVFQLRVLVTALVVWLMTTCTLGISSIDDVNLTQE